MVSTGSVRTAVLIFAASTQARKSRSSNSILWRKHGLWQLLGLTVKNLEMTLARYIKNCMPPRTLVPPGNSLKNTCMTSVGVLLLTLQSKVSSVYLKNVFSLHMTLLPPDIKTKIERHGVHQSIFTTQMISSSLKN